MNAVTLRQPTAEEIAQARLPARYETARQAIAECERIDELKDMADKQAALCTYFRLSRDTTLHNLALRIQQRAQRRMGELLKQIPAVSASNLVQHRQDGAVPSATRTAAADAAGLSERQRKTAIRIASVPEADFERVLESERPLTVTQMAELGMARRGPVAAAVQEQADETQSALRAFAEFCDEHEGEQIAQVISPSDASVLRGTVARIDAWLDRFVTSCRQMPETMSDLNHSARVECLERRLSLLEGARLPPLLIRNEQRRAEGARFRTAVQNVLALHPEYRAKHVLRALAPEFGNNSIRAVQWHMHAVRNRENVWPFVPCTCRASSVAREPVAPKFVPKGGSR